MSRAKTTVPLVLGIVSILSLIVFVLIFVFGDRLDTAFSLWLLLPTLSFTAGGVAAPLGGVGWSDARKGGTKNELAQAQIGTILALVSVGLITICVLGLLIAAIITIGSWNEGVD